MEVIMRVSISGTRDGADWPKIGERIGLPDAEALQMLNAGMVKPAPEPEPERAIVDDPDIENREVSMPRRTKAAAEPETA